MGDWIDGDAAHWFRRIEKQIADLAELVMRLIDMNAQSAIDAATADITSATTTLSTAEPEIEALLSQGVDTTELTAALAPLNAAVAGIKALANPVTTASTTTSTGTGTTTSTVTSTGTTTSSTVTGTPAAEPRRTTGTGAPGDPVREI